MSVTKFLSTTSELTSTLLTDLLSTNQACYKLAVDESLVDVSKSSLKNEVKSRRKFICRRKLLIPISFLNENIPPIKILYHNSYSFFPNKIEIKELKT